MPEKELDDPVANTEGGGLAKLWRKILNETGMRYRLEALVTQYLTRPDNDQNNSTVFDKRKNRSTIWSNILANDMTIKTFMDLIFNVINIRHVKLTIELTDFINKKSVHNIEIINPKHVNHKILTEEDKNAIKSGTTRKDNKKLDDSDVKSNIDK